MKRLLLLIVVCAMSVSPLLQASELETTLLLGEVQAGSLTSASEEFIEVKNVSQANIDLSGYVVQYFSGSAADFSSPSRTIVLGGILESGRQTLLASSGYLADVADVSFSAGIAKSAGHIRLVRIVNSVETQLDLLAWGTALHPETAPSPAMPDGQSLKRIVDEDGKLVDTNNNSTDFSLSNAPTPESTDEVDVSIPEVDPVPDLENEPAPPLPEETPEQPGENPGEGGLGSGPIEETPPPLPEVIEPVNIIITELLPDPASPATDAEDEFVEIYNAGTRAVDLKEYRLQTGNNYNYTYEFQSVLIEPGAYMVVYSKDSSLTLSNSSGRARLLTATGDVLSETDQYSEAEEGESWILLNGLWQWTTSPTPAGLNALALTPLAGTSKLLKAATTKKAAAKKTTAAKATTTKPKASSATKAKTAERGVYDEPDGDGQVTPIHPQALAAVGLLAVGYMAYEYRKDMGSRLYQLRRYIRARRAARLAS